MIVPKWLETIDPKNNFTGTGRLYWFRTPMGLEAVAGDEIKAKLPVRHCFESHRNVFVELSDSEAANNNDIGAQIRTADDVYLFWGVCRGVDRTKESVRSIISFLRPVLPHVLPPGADRTFIRTTVSFVGKRNFNRFFVESKVADLFSSRPDLVPLSNENKDPKVEQELRLRCHIEEDMAFLGLGVRDTPLHRRSWRRLKYPGQLHTPVAGAMARVLDPERGSAVYDPFCGSGTILIESALQHPDCQHYGWDLSDKAIDIARQSATEAGVTVQLQVADSFEERLDKKNFYLLSNPPWDEKHQISPEKRERFVAALAHWVRQSRAAVLLLPEELVQEVEKTLGESFERLVQTRIRGKLAAIVKFGS